MPWRGVPLEQAPGSGSTVRSRSEDRMRERVVGSEEGERRRGCRRRDLLQRLDLVVTAVRFHRRQRRRLLQPRRTSAAPARREPLARLRLRRQRHVRLRHLFVRVEVEAQRGSRCVRGGRGRRRGDESSRARPEDRSLDRLPAGHGAGAARCRWTCRSRMVVRPWRGRAPRTLGLEVAVEVGRRGWPSRVDGVPGGELLGLRKSHMAG